MNGHRDVGGPVRSGLRPTESPVRRRGGPSFPAGVVGAVTGDPPRPRRSGREAAQGPRHAFPLAQQVTGVGRESAVSVRPSGGPGDFDPVGAGILTEAEVEAGVAGRLIAAPADAPGGPATTAGRDRDAGADRLALRRRRFQQERQRVTALGAVVEIGQRPVERRDHQVDPAVIVEVAGGEAPADPRDQPGRPGRGGPVDELAAGQTQQELRGHPVGEERAEVVNVPVGGRQVEPAVGVGVEEGDAEAESLAGRDGQAGRRGHVGEDAIAAVLVEGGVLVVEVGDGQVGAAVAVRIAAGDPHPRLVDAVAVARHAGRRRDLLEAEPPRVAEEEIGRLIVGDEEVEPAVAVEVGGDDPQAPAVAVDDPRLGGRVDEPAPVVAEEVVGPAGALQGTAGDVLLQLRVPAGRGMLRVPGEVMADIKVEVAVAVEVGERRRGRPVAIAAQPGPQGDVLERAVPRLR